MLSIENFYWILYENLLQPAKIDCWYFYPFGTQDNLSANGEFKDYEPRQEHHVLFYDQEPIFTDSFSKYDTLWSTWSTKLVKILANSEHSIIKDKICQHRGFIDWYYFYHGFASLDWFRDCRFICSDNSFKKVFSSLNHIVTGHRAYRMSLTARLLRDNLYQYGHVSFHANRESMFSELQNPMSMLSQQEKKTVANHMFNHDSWPCVLDTANITGNHSACLGHREYKLWQNSFVHLVNETIFYDAKLHLTEKIFKPIVSLRPFILAAAPGNLAYLRSYGFETFHHWWDESYDSEEDPDVRLDRIVEIIAKLCSRSRAELDQMHDEMKPVLEYNKSHFFGEFRRIIVDELVENFDSCVRIWNNGRIDRRDRPLHPDLQSVKEILLR